MKNTSLFWDVCTNPTVSPMPCTTMNEIKADFHALYEAMNGMPLREMDQIVYPVCTLCRDHQKSGFMEGVRIGFQLCSEITGGSNASI